MAGDREEDPSSAEAEARAWLVRLSSGAIDAEELARFRSWLARDARHDEAFRAARRLWHEAGALEGAFTAPSLAPRAARRLRLGGIAAVAASLLALWILGDGWLARLRADHRTAVGEQARIALPDGSLAHLNTDSAIAVRYGDGQRRVELLRGEAFFEVRPDPERPFRVASLEGAAEAVGTAFVVRRDGERTRVTVVSGRVAVASPEPAAVGLPAPPLAAGEEIAYRRGAPPEERRRVDPALAAAWRDGRIRIDGASLPAALAEIDRYLPGRVVAVGRARASGPVSGIFATERAAEGLAALAAAEGLSVPWLGGMLAIVH